MAPSQDDDISDESAVYASRILADLDPDGTASFDESILRAPPEFNRAGSSNTLGSEEDYDHVIVDPSTVVEGSRGGGLPSEPTLAGRRSSLTEVDVNQARSSLKRPSGGLRKSIPIRLQTTDTKGRYLLHAEESELQEIFQRITDYRDKPKSTRFTDLVFTRQFTAFDRLNPTSGASPFHGFYTLFWLCIVFLLFKIAADNWRVSGSIFGTNELLTMMFTGDIVVMGLSDIFMMCSTVFCLGLQKLIYMDWLSWNGSGWLIQSAWQLLYISGTVRWTIHREWPWQHTVFLTLHCIVMLMKQHSYGFYNGHLSEVYKRKRFLEVKLKELDFLVSMTGSLPASVPQSPVANAIATSYFDDKGGHNVRNRRHSLNKSKDSKGQQDHSDILEVAAAIKTGKPLNMEQIASFERVLESEIDALGQELRGKCTDTQNHYPWNLNYRDFVDYIPLPTVTYELEYPRQGEINWYYVAEKIVATFGVIAVMIIISQAFIYPVVMHTIQLKEQGLPLAIRLKEFPWILSDLLFPFLVEYLLAWYVIWECVLNTLAELTRFADRGFYADWWNSVSWDQFARDWNVPVHNFLLRHVYHSSISSFRVSRQSATLITFLLSAVVHELVMWCIFKKLRGYLLCMQMMQLPLVMLSKTKLLRQRKALGNVVFWIGIFTGPSLLCSLYLVI